VERLKSSTWLMKAKICCEQVGCFCGAPCPPLKDDPGCQPIPSPCRCGIDCTPLFGENGERLFPNLDAAIQAVWDNCVAHKQAAVETEPDCVYIDFADPNDPPDIRLICKDILKPWSSPYGYGRHTHYGFSGHHGCWPHTDSMCGDQSSDKYL